MSKRAPEFDERIGEKLEWRPFAKSGYVRLERDDSDPTDRSKWPEQHEWFCTRLRRFYEVFSPIAKNWSDEESQTDADQTDNLGQDAASVAFGSSLSHAQPNQYPTTKHQ